jgi:hypothetical protein
MIVVAAGPRLRLVTQRDHAHLAAELLSLFPALADEPRRAALLRATRRHDDGWQGVDAAPPVDEEGRPHDFLGLPWSFRSEIWDRGTSLPDVDDETALLIAEHALALHREHRGREGPGGRLVELLEARREQVRERLGQAASHQVSLLYPWLGAADLLSLIVVNGWKGRTFELDMPADRAPRRARLEPRGLLLDPFPLAGSTTLHYPERRIESRQYRSTFDLGTALARARWVVDSVTIRSWS